MYTLTYDQITVEFGVSRVVATLGLSLFVMGLGIGPMVLGPLSEVYRTEHFRGAVMLITDSSMVGGRYTWYPLHSS